MTNDTEEVVIVAEKYKDSAKLNVERNDNGEYIVENHDFLESNGFTESVVQRVSVTSDAYEMIEDMIITPGDCAWRDEYHDIGVGEEVVL